MSVRIFNSIRLLRKTTNTYQRMDQRDLLTNIEQFTKEELVEQIHRLQKHVQQLRNVIAKQEKIPEKKDHNKQRKFNFLKYKKRHVALKVTYLGWNYQGFVVQEDSANTVEAIVFNALLTAKLIESRQTSNYHRCGRTDKGVSAFSQIMSLDLRTNLLEGEGVYDYEGCTASERIGNTTMEVDYTGILNKLLPKDIQVIAWCPVPQNFSARFDCISRTYKYFFPRGDLNIQEMNEALKYLIGEHDFRNFCKFDPSTPMNFMRSIKFADIRQCDVAIENFTGDNKYEIFELTIQGKAFLWHQIRCIVAVLFFIGHGKESPEIINELLDVEKNPLRPDYGMSSDLPLVLYDCEFENIQWKFDKNATQSLLCNFQRLWSAETIKSVIISKALKDIIDIANLQGIQSLSHQTSSIAVGTASKTHKPLMNRQKCKSAEERNVIYAKKLKFKENDDEEMQS